MTELCQDRLSRNKGWGGAFQCMIVLERYVNFWVRLDHNVLTHYREHGHAFLPPSAIDQDVAHTCALNLNILVGGNVRRASKKHSTMSGTHADPPTMCHNTRYSEKNA